MGRDSEWMGIRLCDGFGKVVVDLSVAVNVQPLVRIHCKQYGTRPRVDPAPAGTLSLVTLVAVGFLVPLFEISDQGLRIQLGKGSVVLRSPIVFVHGRMS